MTTTSRDAIELFEHLLSEYFPEEALNQAIARYPEFESQLRAEASPYLYRSETSSYAEHEKAARFIHRETSKEPLFPSDTVSDKYTIIERIGRGAFSVVYSAREEKLSRDVAIKVFMDRRRTNLTEARKLAALLGAPHIVAVYEVGQHGEWPYIAMELCKKDLASRVRSYATVSQDVAVRDLRQIAAGLVSAFTRGLIHRDLKPANIFVAQGDSLKVGDFGEAHNELDGQAARQLRGTLSYIAPELLPGPEQADPTIDTPELIATVKTDVYSLGVVAYQLLTGVVPFVGEDPAALLVAMKAGVHWPRTREISKDLQCIVERCLALDPGKRYESAAEVVRELEHWEQGRGLDANRRISAERWLRWWRYSGTNKAIASLLASLAFMFGAVVPSIAVRQYWLANDNRALFEMSESQRRDLQRGNERLHDLMSRNLFERGAAEKALGNDQEAAAFLSAAAVEAAAGSQLSRTINAALAVWDEDVGLALVHDGQVVDSALSSDGRLAATAGADRNVQLWQISESGTPTLVRKISHGAKVNAVRFSPDGSRLVSGTEDGLIHVSDVRTGELVAEPFNHGSPVFCLAISADGHFLLSGSDTRGAQLWDLRTYAPNGERFDHPGAVWATAFSPDGAYVAICGQQGVARIWRRSSHERLAEVRRDDEISCLAFTGDSKLLITGGYDGVVRMNDVTTGDQAGADMVHAADVTSLVLTPSGNSILVGTADGGPYRWSLRRQIAVEQKMLWSGFGKIAALQHDGKRMLVLDRFHATYHDLSADQTSLAIDSEATVSITAASQASLIAVQSTDVTWIMEDRGTRGIVKSKIRHGDAILSSALRADGQALLTGSASGLVRIYEVKSGMEIHGPLRHPAPVTSVLFRNAHQVLSAAADLVYVWDVNGEPRLEATLPHLGLSCMTLSPNGDRLITAGDDRILRTWSTTSRQETLPHVSDSASILAMAVSPDGRLCATCSDNQVAQIWQTSDLSRVGDPITTPSAALTVAFSPDSLLIALGCRDGSVVISSITPRVNLAARSFGVSPVRSLAWHPVTQSLVIGTEKGAASFWRFPMLSKPRREAIVLFMTVKTGVTVDRTTSTITALNLADWLSRKKQLLRWRPQMKVATQ